MELIIDLPVYEPVLKKIQALEGITLRVLPEPSVERRPLAVAEIENAEILLCTLPPENHLQMKKLKLVQIASSGYTQLINQGFPERNIRCCNALGVFDVPIAEWNIAMMINLARDFKGMLSNQQNKTWDRSARFQEEIRGRIVGIWGYGGIGRETARLAKALGMKVYVLSRSELRHRTNTYCVPGTGDPDGALPDRVFYMNEKESFLKTIDFLIMAIPQTAVTEGIVGEKELRLLKPSAFLLNPARGPLIKEAALVKALQEKWFAGAALDTHYHYPMPPDHPLWEMPHVLFTPHISGSSASPHFLERVWDVFYQNLLRYRNQEPLLNELSVKALNGE